MWQIEKKTRLEGLGKCQYSQDFWRQRPRNERSISPIPLFASLWCLSHAKKRKWRAKTIVDLSSWHCNGKGRGSALWPLWKKAWGEGKVLPSMCQWRGWWQKSIWEIFFDKYATTWSVFRPFSSVRPLFLTKKSYFSTLFSIGEFSLFFLLLTDCEGREELLPKGCEVEDWPSYPFFLAFVWHACWLMSFCTQEGGLQGVTLGAFMRNFRGGPECTCTDWPFCLHDLHL